MKIDKQYIYTEQELASWLGTSKRAVKELLAAANAPKRYIGKARVVRGTDLPLLIKMRGVDKMATKEKIRECGVYYVDDEITYAAGEYPDEPGTFSLTHHTQDMPAHHEELFNDIDKLVCRMKEIAALNKWRQRER